MTVHSIAVRISMKYMAYSVLGESRGEEGRAREGGRREKRGGGESNAFIALPLCERDSTVLQRDTTPLRSFLLFSGTETALYLNFNRKDTECDSFPVKNLGSSSLVHFQSKPYILFPFILISYILAEGLSIPIFPTRHDRFEQCMKRLDFCPSLLAVIHCNLN
jgi:hypothetical protein